MKRIRQNKPQPKLFEEDSFCLRNDNPFELLKEFLKERRKYVNKNYPEYQKIVIFELDLYEQTLNRIIKHFNI